MDKITVFTPTYNRSHLLPYLYNSLKKQTNKNFEWLVIDDGSTDNTQLIFNEWLNEINDFNIRYYKIKNGGKQRAINEGVKLAKYDYFFIVDSDDRLTYDAIDNIINWIAPIKYNYKIAGVAGIKGNYNGELVGPSPIYENGTYIETTNLERSLYKIPIEMAEVYKTDILKKYPFTVWKDEKFTPEGFVWNAIALDGYKLRWYNKIIYLFEYQDDGLTSNGYRSYYYNLMGWAITYNLFSKIPQSLKKRIHYINEALIACILKKEYNYILKMYYPFLAIIIFPFSYLFALKRKKEILRNI